MAVTNRIWLTLFLQPFFSFWALSRGSIGCRIVVSVEEGVMGRWQGVVGLALLLAACTAPAPEAALAPGAAPAEPASSPATRPLETVHIGYPSRSVTFLAMFLARDQGYFEQQGLAAELSQVRTNVGITALLNGELDYTESLGSNIRAALQGAPIKTVSVSMRAPTFMLVARPEYPAVAQLRGRVVGITSFGGSNDQTARLIFKHYGLAPQADVQLVPIGDAPVQYEALRLGQVDAVVISQPFPLLARKEGFNLLVNAPEVVSMPLAGLGTRQAKLDAQRDQVKRVVKAELQALRHLRTQPEDAIKLIAELFDTDAATAQEVYAFLLPSFSEDGSIERAGIELVLELEREEGRSGAPLAFEQVAEPAIVAEAQRELGLRP
jgi:NitT/TauT family transport system substrate-binding protein